MLFRPNRSPFFAQIGIEMFINEAEIIVVVALPLVILDLGSRLLPHSLILGVDRQNFLGHLPLEAG
jgi:hypothetical protein